MIKEQRLTIVNECDYITKSGKILPGYLCKCSCGNTKIVSKNDYKSGGVRSCGCLIRDFNASRAKYYDDSLCFDLSGFGLNKTQRDKILNSYKAMISRCYNKNHKNYKNYGGRGIVVCDEWKSSKKSFAEWALSNGFKVGKSIDRINVNGNYCPENCRWATREEQDSNTRRNVFIVFNGQKLTITQLSKKIGLDAKILSRLAKEGIELRKENEIEVR